MKYWKLIGRTAVVAVAMAVLIATAMMAGLVTVLWASKDVACRLW